MNSKIELGTEGATRHKGNTSKLCHSRTRQRARSWCFTFNNYTENDPAQLAKGFQQLGTKKYCFQEEKGENGTRHLQGVINFKNAIEFSTLKKLNPKIHWEKCLNIKASIKYCSKPESKNGETFTYGIDSRELWHEVRKYTHREMLQDAKAQMLADNKGVAKEWADLEVETFKGKNKYMNCWG